jgi:hypothetical protein
VALLLASGCSFIFVKGPPDKVELEGSYMKVALGDGGAP